MPAKKFIKDGKVFINEVDQEMSYLVNELVPEGVIVLIHGEPRTKKSWACLELGLAVANGFPAFGMERFGVGECHRVLYCSEEDGPREVRKRVKRMLEGKHLGVKEGVEMIDFAIHEGINFDHSFWEEQIIAAIKARNYKLVIFDPIRRFSTNVDKGPAEVVRISGLLRRIVAKTGATVLIDHHDVKPSINIKDTRRRSHRASGGDWFAMADCPIAFEKNHDHSDVFPEDYKFDLDPSPFTLKIEENPEKTWIRVMGYESENSEDKMVSHIKAVLRHGPKGTKEIMHAVTGKNETIVKCLHEYEGLLFGCEKGAGNKPTIWYLV